MEYKTCTCVISFHIVILIGQRKYSVCVVVRGECYTYSLVLIRKMKML